MNCDNLKNELETLKNLRDELAVYVDSKKTKEAAEKRTEIEQLVEKINEGFIDFMRFDVENDLTKILQDFIAVTEIKLNPDAPDNPATEIANLSIFYGEDDLRELFIRIVYDKTKKMAVFMDEGYNDITAQEMKSEIRVFLEKMNKFYKKI